MSDSEDEFQSADEGEHEALDKRERANPKSGTTVSGKLSPSEDSENKSLEKAESLENSSSAGDPAALSEQKAIKSNSKDPEAAIAGKQAGDSSKSSSVSDKSKNSPSKGKASSNTPKGNKGGKSQRKNKNKKENKSSCDSEVAASEPVPVADESKGNEPSKASEESTISQSDISSSDQSEQTTSETPQLDKESESADQSGSIPQNEEELTHISSQNDIDQSDVSKQNIDHSGANIVKEPSKKSSEADIDFEPTIESESTHCSSDETSTDIKKSSAVDDSVSNTDTNADSSTVADSVSNADTNAEQEAVDEQPADVSKPLTGLLDKLSSSGESSSAVEQRGTREESVLERLALAGEKQSSSGWGSWGSWGSSLLTTASSSIHTFTGQVSEGMHTVVETFEATVGAPPPDQLDDDISKFVKEPDEEEEVITKDSPAKEVDREAVAAVSSAADGSENDDGTEKSVDKSDWFSSWGVSGITNQLQSTTKGLVESGLDVLETIGKKTMEQIKETDPGFNKTKGLFHGNKTNLSQTLREAKEESEKRAAEELNAQPLTSYSSLFDQHQGLACLEALELLSISCTNSLSSLEEISEETQQHMDSLSEKFTQVYDSDEECEEEHDFSAGIEDFVSKLSLPVKHSRIISVQSKAREWLIGCQERQDAGERIEGRDIHNEALNSFAELTSSTVEICHKSGALLLLSPEQESTVDVDSVSDAFISILRLVNAELSIQSQKYNECLNTAADDSEDPDSINPMITNVFLEATNSSSYVRDAFKLLIPVLHKCLVIETESKVE